MMCIDMKALNLVMSQGHMNKVISLFIWMKIDSSIFICPHIIKKILNGRLDMGIELGQ